MAWMNLLSLVTCRHCSVNCLYLDVCDTGFLRKPCTKTWQLGCRWQSAVFDCRWKKKTSGVVQAGGTINRIQRTDWSVGQLNCVVGQISPCPIYARSALYTRWVHHDVRKVSNIYMTGVPWLLLRGLLFVSQQVKQLQQHCLLLIPILISRHILAGEGLSGLLRLIASCYCLWCT